MRKSNSKKRHLPTKFFPGLVRARSSDLRSLVISWNNDFPVDYWWRKQYNVPFGSESHRSMTFVEMAFEYLEFVEYRVIEIEHILESKRKTDIKNNELFTQTSPGKEVVHMSKKEAAEEYDNLDLSQFNDK